VVAADILREALSRKWFLALGAGLTLVLGAIGLGLRMEVVDGALAATRLFGRIIDHDIRSADVALRPVFQAAAWIVYYGGLVFGVLSCADFGPSLLSPGRIEHLLALPVRRWELLLGTWLGVCAIAILGAIYGAGGLSVILGLKTGVWTLRPVAAGLLASASFAALYAPMLVAALWVRSAAFTAALGGLLFAAGVVASFRADIAPLFEQGAGRQVFLALTLPLPRVAALGQAAGEIAASAPVDWSRLGELLTGFGVFGLGALALGAARFDGRDF